MRVVLLEADDGLSCLYSSWLSVVGECRVATSAEQGVFLCEEFKPHLVLTELNLQDGESGFVFLAYLKRYCPSVVSLVITNEGTIENAIKASSFGILDFLVKPINKARFSESVKKSYESLRLSLAFSEDGDHLDIKVDAQKMTAEVVPIFYLGNFFLDILSEKARELLPALDSFGFNLEQSQVSYQAIQIPSPDQVSDLAVKKAIAICSGELDCAAKLLGVSPASLHRSLGRVIMRSMGLSDPISG